MSLNLTLRWLSGAWRNKVRNKTIQNCYIKSIVLPGRRLSNQDQTNQDQTNRDIALDPELRPLYHQVVDKLAFQSDAEEILPFEEFPEPIG
jgi:hypothetical protein